MKFRCNICFPRFPTSFDADTWDEGMRRMQDHINDQHNAGEAVVEDVTINFRSNRETRWLT